MEVDQDKYGNFHDSTW